MKPQSRVFGIVVLTLLASCAGAGDGKLTNEKAANALRQWNSSCNATVTGIQEVATQNLAKADLNFSNCTFPVVMQNVRPQNKDYTGHGEAIFTHYNDGRWVLTQVSAKEGWPPFEWDNLSIEAK